MFDRSPLTSYQAYWRRPLARLHSVRRGRWYVYTSCINNLAVMPPCAGPLAGELPILSLRTNKADVAVGIAPDVLERVEKEDPRWRVNGRCAASTPIFRGLIEAQVRFDFVRRSCCGVAELDRKSYPR